MVIFEKKLSEGALLGVWKLEEDLTELLSQLEQKEWYLPHIERFSSVNRKIEWLVVRVLLKQMCGEEEEIHYHPNGQPFLTDGSFFISISHTKHYVAVLLHPTRQVGVDIEWKSDRILKVKNKFLRQEDLLTIDKKNEIDYLLLLWSAKESMYKALGVEGVDFAEQLLIDPFLLQKEGVLSARALVREQVKEQNIHYIVFPDIVLTWVIC